MTPLDTSRRSELRLLVTAALVVGLQMFAAVAAAQDEPGSALARQGFTDPAEIDRAVADFTGVPIGEIGGARMPADRRLRLAACAGPLMVDWHGTARSTLKVACPGPQSWRIFIATQPAPQAEASTPIVSRGDPITVMVRGRGFTVQQTAEAMENGSIGDWIAVRTSRDATPLRVQIERPGLALIPAS